jgi:hypothetical protein
MNEAPVQRPILIQCCFDPPAYNSGSMATADVEHVPAVVLEDLLKRIEAELAARKRIRMIIREGAGA